MHTRIERDFCFQTGLYFENKFHVNVYDIAASMLVETDSIKEQNIAMDRTIHFLTEVLSNSILVHSANSDVISLFSRYVSGAIPASDLKDQLKSIQFKREVAKNPPKEKIQWRVTHPNGRATITLMAASAEEAIKLAKQEYNDTMNPDDAYRAEPMVPSAQTSELPSTNGRNQQDFNKLRYVGPAGSKNNCKGSSSYTRTDTDRNRPRANDIFHNAVLEIKRHAPLWCGGWIYHHSANRRVYNSD